MSEKHEEMAREIETAVGGAYEMPDGRDFWIDGQVAREITRRVMTASALSRIEAETEARVLGEIAKKIRSPMFQKFLEQGFWHAHHVDMTWRYNGKDVGEEADWLKDVWYAIRSTKNLPTSPKSVADTGLSVSGEVIDAPNDEGK